MPETSRKAAWNRGRLRALGAAGGDGGAAAVGWIRTTHMGIAQRWFKGLGPVGWPARMIHDSAAGATYFLVGSGLKLAGRGAGIAASLTPAASAALSGPRAGALLAAANGLWGDQLSRQHPELAIQMSLRSGGEDVPVRRAALADAYPAAGRRLAVFLHGLCESEESWGRPAADDDAPGTYGDALRRELGMAPLFVRYNSGLPVVENGERLAHLLEELVVEWPEEVEELALVGHSMGGLVMRAAMDIAARAGQPWTELLRHCVYLGTPHDGAPLARGAAALARALRRLPETTAIADVLDVRSAGIRDLEEGYAGTTEPMKHERMTTSPARLRTRHHVVGASLGPSARHPLSRAVGDLLVTPDSAAGRGRSGFSLRVDERDRRELAGISHFRLLDHPAVAEALREWLTPD